MARMPTVDLPPIDDDEDVGPFTNSEEHVELPPISQLPDKILSPTDNEQAIKLPPIFQLPDEILMLIFEINAHESRGQMSHRISAVCKHWRTVALTCASLWVYLDYRRRDSIPTLLARSQQINGLDVYIGSHFIQPEECYNVLSQLTRIQALVVQLNVTSIDPVLNAVPLVSAPLLQRLTVEALPGSGPIPTLSGLAHLEAPKLRYLELKQCRINWDWRFIRSTSFTHFHIRCKEYNPPPSLNRLLDILQNSRQLELLVLTNAIPLSQTVGRIVSLPNLQHLTIAGRVMDCYSFLRQLNIPPNATLQLRCETIVTIAIFQNQILPLIHAQCQQYYLRSLTLTWSGWQSCKFTIAGYTKPSPAPSDHPRFKVALTVNDETADDKRKTDIIGAICSRIRFVLERLEVDCAWQESPGFWVCMRPWLGEVRELTMRVMPTGLAKALSEDAALVLETESPTPNPDTNASHFLLPKLETIHILGVDFPPDLDAFLFDLRFAQEVRERRGSVLNEVKIKQCKFVPADFKRKVWEFVEIVQWDGEGAIAVAEEEEEEEDAYSQMRGSMNEIMLFDSFAQHARR